MTAALQTTFANPERVTEIGMPGEPLDMLDVSVWEKQQADRPYPNFQSAWFGLSRGASLTTPVVEAVAFIGKELARARKRGEERHWSYDANRHIALKQMHSLLERFEANQSAKEA